jgi:hypothetical protein
MKKRPVVWTLLAMVLWGGVALWARPAAAECGDGACDITQEGCYSCAGDCGECPGTEGSSCAGQCGYNRESCWCDELCHPYADCCADVCLQCPMLPGCSSDQCGNGACDEGESCYSCPADCGDCNLCGDTHCGEQEDCQSCPADCGACEGCGNGECVAPEDCHSCPMDCGYCPDCENAVCGNLENCFACPQDCGDCINCGDGQCAPGENCNNCAQDCGECCGDGTCAADAGEDCTSCPEDCGACADCGNKVCDDGESCDSCPQDCGECCGDGVCDESKGESCLLCPADCKDCCGDGNCGGEEDCKSCKEDCGECCGDGKCDSDAGEDCETCEADCGKCECTIYPDLGWTWNFGFDFQEGINAAGTGAGVKVGLNASSHKGLDKDKGICTEGLSGGGEVGACMSVVYQKMCFVYGLDMGGQCEKALTCDAPPKWVCDESNYCCGGTIMGSGTFSRSWEPEKKFAIWKLEAKCGFNIGGTVGMSLSGNSKWGPLCDCPSGSAWVTVRVKGGASGGGGCSVKAFGKEFVGIGASANACANVGVAGGYGCGGAIGEPVGGASFTVKVNPFTVGWFTISGVVKNWGTGSGCTGATDY